MGEHASGGATHPATGRIIPGDSIEHRAVRFIGVVMQNFMDVLNELSCGEDERAEAALPHLAAWGPEVVELLRERLFNPEAEVRWWAVRGLAEIKDERVPELLVQALADVDKSVRWCAGLALRDHPSIMAAPTLASLLSDEDTLTRRLAGDALIALGSLGVPRLLEALQSGPTPARIEATRALAKIADERAIPALFEALDDSSALVEFWANEGLEKMGVGMVYYKPA